VIPEQAIFPRGEHQFFYVVDDGAARLREVQVGQRIPGAAEILHGLSAGEILVVAGLQRIGDGTTVHSE
jgi:membrane fusion protein, multidrug efflux system